MCATRFKLQRKQQQGQQPSIIISRWRETHPPFDMYNDARRVEHIYKWIWWPDEPSTLLIYSKHMAQQTKGCDERGRDASVESRDALRDRCYPRTHTPNTKFTFVLCVRFGVYYWAMAHKYVANISVQHEVYNATRRQKENHVADVNLHFQFADLDQWDHEMSAIPMRR